MSAVNSAKGLSGISVVDSAAEGISGSIVPVSNNGGAEVKVVIAVVRASLVAWVLLGRRGEGSARLVDLVAVSFAWGSASISSVRGSVGAVNQNLGSYGNLNVVQSAGKRVSTDVVQDLTNRVERTQLGARIVGVQGSRSHTWVSVGSIATEDGHVAVSITVRSANSSTGGRGVRAVKGSICGSGTSVVFSAGEGVSRGSSSSSGWERSADRHAISDAAVVWRAEAIGVHQLAVVGAVLSVGKS